MIYAKKMGKKERKLIFIQVQTFLGVRIMPTLRYPKIFLEVLVFNHCKGANEQSKTVNFKVLRER